MSLQTRRYVKKNLALYFMMIPGLLVVLVFSYLPMYGIVIAFQNYSGVKGYWGSEWVGFEHFAAFFRDPYFFRIFKNTFLLGLFTLLFNFPAPILLALLLNEVRAPVFKKVAQTISYMPYFLSTVIVVGMLKELLSINDGVVNDILLRLTGDKFDFFLSAAAFRPLYIGTGVWQGVGFSSIIYLAAISGIGTEQYESAVLDGATRFQQAVHITLPNLAPTITTLFILAVGGILGSDMQKILLIYNPATYETADVISTYVYRMGILGSSFSYAAAVGLFTSVFSFFFVFLTNWVCKALSDNYLW